MEILQSFGVQPILLVAQIINFLILLFVLRKLLYKPILKMLDERKQRIAESMKQAQEIEERFAKLEEEQKAMLQKARQEADALLTQTKDAAKTLTDQLTSEARQQSEKIIEKAQEAAKREHDQMQKELRGEIVTLAVEVAQKATQEILTPEQKKKLTSDAIQDLRS